jgi:hypothetical protein
MNNSLKKLIQLTKSKKIQDIKFLLEREKRALKGILFEKYLVYLYRGNGFFPYRLGGSGDRGVDILLFKDNISKEVSLSIQAKNHIKPLDRSSVLYEYRKFVEKSPAFSSCSKYLIISISGFSNSSSELSLQNFELLGWNYIKSLISTFDLENQKAEIHVSPFISSKSKKAKPKIDYIKSNLHKIHRNRSFDMMYPKLKKYKKTSRSL